MNLYAARGVIVREFPLDTGEADCLLFVDRKAVGVVEAKPEGGTLSGVADQAAKYSVGLPDNIPHVTLPLPFLYESTAVETFFRHERDPEPRSRRVFTFHRPEALADLLVDTVTLRARLCNLPAKFPLITTGLWGAQIQAINNLEQSLTQNHPRRLIQMATGSGKTFTAVSFVNRLIKHAKAKRVLFLVDRNNLGRQAFKEFDQYLHARRWAQVHRVVQRPAFAQDGVMEMVSEWNVRVRLGGTFAVKFMRSKYRQIALVKLGALRQITMFGRKYARQSTDQKSCWPELEIWLTKCG